MILTRQFFDEIATKFPAFVLEFLSIINVSPAPISSLQKL